MATVQEGGKEKEEEKHGKKVQLVNFSPCVTVACFS
jgi:hypothetical protein